MVPSHRSVALPLILLFLSMFLIACGSELRGGGENIHKFAASMSWHPGFVSFYQDEREGKIYLLLDPGNAELIYQESLPRGVGSNDIGLDRGQLGGGAALVRFEAAGNKVLMRRVNQRYRADSSDAAERASVEEAFASSVLWGFPVVARDGEQRLVDATEFLLRDTHGVARRLKELGEGTFDADVSRSAVYAPRSRAFPRNTELEAVITLLGVEPGEQVRSVAPDPHAITVHMHHSFIALPEPGYEPRIFHPESGYMAVGYADYAAPLEASMQRRFVRRHRLQKRDPNAAVSDVLKPIVYYLDPGTPEPVRSALLDGARWWTQAFEAAGFRNAYRVEMLPDDADPMDVRYNVIQWVHRSTRGWSYGSSVLDPRTGEIIKGHVTLGSLRVRQDLLLARGMTSPFGEEGAGDALTSAMALARIRQLSAHEVGHTLGLAHNFAASARDRASVMDYPYPRMRLSDDGNIVLDDAYGEGLGEWDIRSIRYGYAEFGTFADEAAGLAALLRDNREQGFAFISDPDSRRVRDFHPASHLWDNGEDPVGELKRLMELRRHALARFGVDSLPAGAPLSDLQEALVPVYFFHRYQVEAVAKLVGGFHYRYALNRDAPEDAVSAVMPGRQRDAFNTLLRTLAPAALALPESLLAQIPPKAYGYQRTRESAPARTGALFDPLTLAEAGASHTLGALLHPERLARLALQHSRNNAHLSPTQLFQRLQDDLLLPEYDAMAGAIDRRTTGLLLEHWRALLAGESSAPEIRAAARAALLRARRLMRSRSRGDSAYAEFYAYELWMLERVLEDSGALPVQERAPIPPGSPIGASR